MNDRRHRQRGWSAQGLLRAILIGVVLLLASASLPLLAAEPSARLGAVSGTVAVVHADGSTVQPAGPEMPLGPGDRVATVGKSAATLTLAGLGQVELGAATTIVVRELRLDGSMTIVLIELVQGTTVHRLSGVTGSLDYRVVDPSGQAVARARGDASFGLTRDENGSITAGCERCSDGALTFPTDRYGLTSGKARTFTARGDVKEDSLSGGLFDALARGADADDQGGKTPDGNRLPAGQRTGSNDRRPSQDNDDGDATNPLARARIISPINGQVLTSSTLQIQWEAPGFTIVAAAQATNRNQVHAHLILDRDITPFLGTGRPIPLTDPNIIHTGVSPVIFQNVPNGVHRVDLVLATPDHVALYPPVTDTVTFTIASTAPTATTAATVTPTPSIISAFATIANFVYLPDPIVIRAGQAIRWTNLDVEIHTVTADNLSFTSPRMNLGDTFTMTFMQPGTYPYFCEPHPFMHGTVEVQ
jgi:plastocyanin